MRIPQGKTNVLYQNTNKMARKAKVLRRTYSQCRKNGTSFLDEAPKVLKIDLEKAPMINFMAKVLKGIKSTKNAAKAAKEEIKKNGGNFFKRTKAWFKGAYKKGMDVVKKDITPEIGEIAGINSIRQIAKDKGIPAAGLETVKMGVINSATIASYAAAFLVPCPGVATTLSITTNTILRNTKWLKPYSQKLKEAAKKGAGEVIKTIEQAAKESNQNPAEVIKAFKTSYTKMPVRF